MAQQPTDRIEWNILTEKAHSNSVAKLVRLEVIEDTRSVADFGFESPFIEEVCKTALAEWLLGSSRTRKEVGALRSIACFNLSLLGLNGADHGLVHERNRIFFPEFPLIEPEVPLLLVITFEALQRQGTGLSGTMEQKDTISSRSEESSCLIAS